MKKTIKYLVFSLLMLFGFSLNVNAETLPAAKDGKITLDKDYTIESTTFDSTSDVSVLDLNGKTLTLNGKIKVNKAFEIKNGTVIRNSTNTVGSLIEISSELNGTVNLKDLVVDGNKVVMTSSVPNGAGFGVFVRKDSSVILDNVDIKNNYTGTNIASGGLYLQHIKSVILKNSKLYNNRATWTTGGGSAIYVEGGEHFEILNTQIYDNYSAINGVVLVQEVSKFVFDQDSVVRDNEGTAAAGLYINDSSATISGTIENNIATGDNGGGIYTIFKNNSYNNRVVRITKTARIINNETTCAGGGLYVNSYKDNIPGKVIIEGATFSGNKALGTVDASDGLYKDIGGGAIAVARGILEINDIKMSGNTAAINKGNSIIVSHANGNTNGGKLTINGGSFDNSIDLGVGSIVVNGGTFKQDMSKYITNKKLVSKKTTDGYEVVENTTLKDENITFDNDAAMDNDYELVVTEKEADKELVSDIKSVITKEAKNAKDIKILGLYDITVSDGTSEVEMKDGNYRITINLDEKLLKYNSYAGVYVDDEGNVEYLPVEVKDGKAVIITGHLSTYGIVGYNISNPATNSNAEVIVSIILFALMFVGIAFSMKKQEVKA